MLLFTSSSLSFECLNVRLQVKITLPRDEILMHIKHFKIMRKISCATQAIDSTQTYFRS